MGGTSYRTCCWKLSAEDAASLMGGWVHLHDRKSDVARMGGVVTAVDPADEPGFTEQGRFAIISTSRGEADALARGVTRHGLDERSR